MTRYWYDWEFLETGREIIPISLGMVCEDGRELYLINGEFPLNRLQENPWLISNVVPHLPLHPDGCCWDEDHPDYLNVFSPSFMRKKVTSFIGDRAELWGYYAAYDHVCLAQLFGRMIDLPSNIPMYTNDLMQEARHLSVNLHNLAFNPAVHNALADARWTRDAHLALENYGR
jgi:hypothetical protein